MLRTIYISNPDQKRDLLKRYQQDSWVVAHIEARRYIQDEGLKLKTTIAGRSVQRASELWIKLFTINYPQWKVVSDNFIYILLEDWFHREAIPLEYKDIEAFYNFFDQILPILSSKSENLFEEWLAMDPELERRLLGWWKLAQRFWSLLSEQKWVTRRWCPAILLQHEDLLYPSGSGYIFDLGTDVNHLELELILKMSLSLDVTVLIPHVSPAEGFQRILGIYDRIKAAASTHEEVKSTSQTKSLTKTLSSSSSLLREVKVAVAQVRLWLDLGIKPQHIAVVSPAIEDYWNMLRSHLLVEGVAANKSYVARAISLPEVQVWLSRIHLHQSEFDQNHLEGTLFNSVDPDLKTIRYQEFQKKFSRVYDEQKAKSLLQMKFGEGLLPTYSIVEFLDKAYALWLRPDTKLIDRISDDIFSDVEPQWRWPWEIWVKYLELFLGRLEIPIQAPEKEGIWVNNLAPSDWADISHVIVLGCQQVSLREQFKSPATNKDIWAIQRDLGFYLNQTESQKKEFDLSWLLTKNLSSVLLSRSETDANGEPQMTSGFWLKESLNPENQILSPGMLSRWDEVMRQPSKHIYSELAMSTSDQVIMTERLVRDPEVPWMKGLVSTKRPSVSATSLTKLSQCAFKFYAEKILSLSESHIYDLDIDPMYQGSLMHRVLELLVEHYPSLEMTSEELSSLYDEASRENEVAGEHQEFWQLEKPRHLQLITRFIQAEKEWRKQYPHTKPVALEQSIEGFITPQDDTILLTAKAVNEDSLAFRGKIDRVDEDPQGYLGLIDYKASKSAGILSFKNWAGNDQFQLALYAMVIEEGVIEGWLDRKVGAAFYLFLKDQQRGQGFVLDACANSFMATKPVSEDDKQAVWQEMKSSIAAALRHLKEGDFRPIPKDIKLCETCDWRLLCRAPHLS